MRQITFVLLIITGACSVPTVITRETPSVNPEEAAKNSDQSPAGQASSSRAGTLDDLKRVQTKSVSCPKTTGVPATAQVRDKCIAPTIYFPLREHFLLLNAQSALDAFATCVLSSKTPSRRIRLEGHIGVVMTAEYALSLSERPAFAVKRYLESKGLDPNTMEITGMGRRMPMCSEDTLLCKRKNNRVEIIVIE